MKMSALDGAYSVISLLKNEPRAMGTCPNCLGDFEMAKAMMFPEQGDWPLDAKIKGFAKRMELGKRERALKFRREQLAASTERAGTQTYVKRTLEQVASALPSFPFEPGDCRSLQVIDVIAWQGLTATGDVSAISFAEVKAGNKRLTVAQGQVRDAVQASKVRLLVLKKDQAHGPD